MNYRTPKQRRAAHDLNHVLLAAFLVVLALVYAAFVLDYFHASTAAPHAYGFLALLCLPSFVLLALVGVVWHEWRTYRPYVSAYRWR